MPEYTYSYSEVYNLRSKMFADRATSYAKWERAAKFISPDQFQHTKHNNARKDQLIVANIARRSLGKFAAGMSSGATPKQMPWVELTVMDPRKANLSQSKRYFEALQKIYHNVLQVSNFYQVVAMAYKDVGLFSNAAYAVLPHDRYGVYFYPFSVGSYGIMNDSFGDVCMFFRDFEMNVKQVVEKYGGIKETGHIDWTNMDPWVKHAWDQARYADTITLSNVIVPNYRSKDIPFFSSDKKYQSYTFVQSLGAGAGLPSQSPIGFAGGQKAITRPAELFISVKGYDYFPVICPRWEVRPEQDYGCDGPAEIAQGDVQLLQDLEKGRLEAVWKILKPAMVGPSALRRVQASILAGGITYVDEVNDGTKFRRAFDVDPRISELVTTSDKYEQAIEDAFFVPLFRNFMNQARKTHITKAQIEAEKAEGLGALAPVLSQLDRDQGVKLFDILYTVLGSQRRLPPAPRELEGEELRPEFISPLAQAAKASMMIGIEKSVNFISGLSSITQDPGVLKLLKADKLARKYFEMVGLDPSLVLDDNEYQRVLAAIQVQQQQQLEQQRLAQSAATAKDMSQAQMGGSNLLEQFAQGEVEQAI